MKYVEFGRWRDVGHGGVNSTAAVFPEDLRRFINNERWTFASTMPDLPHEYLVRERVDRKLFERCVEHIRSNGYESHFYQKKITYYEEDGLVYWTIGAPVHETTIINRCRKEDSFGVRPSTDSSEREGNESGSPAS